MGRKDPPQRTSGNENQPGPATEIEYLRRQSLLCSVVLRDHSRERLIRCQASLRMRQQSSAGASSTHFHLMGPQFHFMGSSVSLKRTPVSFQTFTHSCGFTHNVTMAGL